MPSRPASPVPQAARQGPSFRAYTARNLHEIPQLAGRSEDDLLEMRAVAAVLPFRTNRHITDELIDWDDADDPIYRLTFPAPEMLDPADLATMTKLLRDDASPERVQAEARDIRRRLNPHPGGQLSLNVPGGEHPIDGLQHKYHETVLFFPGPGQMCHAFCTYCFRWAQFVGEPDLRMACNDPQVLCGYLRRHPEVSDVLLTGGDPMIMRTEVLARFVEPLLEGGLDTVRTIRIGTKAISHWPYRFVTDPDADELCRLFERVVGSGRQLAVMAHYSHPRELAPAVAGEAVRRIRATGASIYAQAPLIRGINDDPGTWTRLWRTGLDLGVVPYYMFVERDTGPRNYFEVPLARGWQIFREAWSQMSGLGRTAKGPVMSATPGKVLVDGVTELAGRRLFALRYVQARDPALVGRPFFADYDPEATWFDQLTPAFPEHREFFRPAPTPAGAASPT
jgi:KamA family protein